LNLKIDWTMSLIQKPNYYLKKKKLIEIQRMMILTMMTYYWNLTDLNWKMNLIYYCYYWNLKKIYNYYWKKIKTRRLTYYWKNYYWKNYYWTKLKNYYWKKIKK